MSPRGPASISDFTNGGCVEADAICENGSSVISNVSRIAREFTSDAPNETKLSYGRRKRASNAAKRK